MPTLRVLALLTLAPQLIPAQDDPFLNWLDRHAQQLLDQRDRALAQVTTKAAADLHREKIRKILTDSLGGFPTYNGPLNARVTGQLPSDGYTIEKVIFECLPGFYITANVYRPNTPSRHPAVLLPSGHTQEGKPENQIIAANLARKGFVALTYDPIGQGEREQTYLPELGRALSGGGGNEHLEQGAHSLLIGQSVARYFIFDAKRAVDYLISRPDVDANRIGVAGCSGGGAIATYVGAFDPRMKAAAAACFINTFRTLFTGPTADSEMSPPRFLVNGFDWADVFVLPAPLPWLLMATTEDYFPPSGAKPVYDQARRIYSLYGAEDKIRFAVGDGPHGTPKESREEIYRWMIRWLNDGKGDPTDQPVKIYTNHELQVTATGNVDNEPRSRKLYQVILEEYRAKRKPRPASEMLALIRQLGVEAPGPTPATTQGQQIRIESEPGVFITGKLYLPKGSGRKPAVIVVEEKRLRVPLYVQPSQSTAAVAEALVERGNIVLELEPRDSPVVVDGRPFLGNWLTNERADLIGRNLPAMRAHDILSAANVLTARDDVDPNAIRAYARGAKGIWLLLAASVDLRLKKIWLDRTPVSYQSAVESPIAGFLFEALIPGFALHWDIKDLVQSIGANRILRTDPTNWMNKPVFPGPGYRYRYLGETLDASLDDFLK